MMLRAIIAAGAGLLLCGPAMAQANRNLQAPPGLNAPPSNSPQNVMPAPFSSIQSGNARRGAPPAPAPAGARKDPAPTVADGMPSLDELTETRERPLFSTTRRPPAVEPPPQTAAVAEGTPMPFELVGIVLGSEITAAIFRNTDTKEEVRVAKGDKIGNWSLEEVADRAVILRGGDRRVRMRLFNEAAAPGLQIGRPGGADADKDQDADDEQVDEEISPANSPQARPATAQPRLPASLQNKQRPRRGQPRLNRRPQQRQEP